MRKRLNDNRKRYNPSWTQQIRKWFQLCCNSAILCEDTHNPNKVVRIKQPSLSSLRLKNTAAYFRTNFYYLKTGSYKSRTSISWQCGIKTYFSLRISDTKHQFPSNFGALEVSQQRIFYCKGLLTMRPSTQARRAPFAWDLVSDPMRRHRLCVWEEEQRRTFRLKRKDRENYIMMNFIVCALHQI